MKRALLLLLALTFVIVFIGCEKAETTTETSTDTTAEVQGTTEAASENDGNGEPNDMVTDESDTYFNSIYDIEDSFTETYKEDKNFLITKSDEYAGDFYEIYDNYGNLLDKGYHGWRGSFDISKNGDIITLEYGFGGTNVFPKYRFYDVANSMVSRYYDGPVDIYGSNVAFFKEENGKVVLAVQNMFDSTEYYREFTGRFDRLICLYIKDIVFSEDGKEITIEFHETDNTDNIIIETFKLD